MTKFIIHNELINIRVSINMALCKHLDWSPTPYLFHTFPNYQNWMPKKLHQVQVNNVYFTDEF